MTTRGKYDMFKRLLNVGAVVFKARKMHKKSLPGKVQSSPASVK